MAAIAAAVLGASASAQGLAIKKGGKKDERFVDLSQFEPRIAIELRYATGRNLAGRPVYPKDARCLARMSVAQRLIAAQEWLEQNAPAGTRLKIWDAYRPAAAHRELWKAFPNKEYLRDPASGGSMHTWGAAVDVTLCDAGGRDLKMPTDFDVLKPAARSIYGGKDAEVRKNLQLLQKAMNKAGFYFLMDEWWHFVAKDWHAFAASNIPLAPKP